jgi:phage gp46-like protein
VGFDIDKLRSACGDAWRVYRGNNRDGDSMSDSQNFEGDLLLYDTPDGGDVNIENGLFINDQSFNTAVYLSLFGGNKDDNGKVKNRKTWWGNMLDGTSESEKLISRFQSVIFGSPMTTKNIQRAESEANLDLKWIIDEGIADKITVYGSAVTRNKFSLYVMIQDNGKSIYENTFAIFWKAGIYGNGL